MLIGLGLGLATVAILAFVLAMSRGGSAGTRAAAAYGQPPQCPKVAAKLQLTKTNVAEFDRAVWCQRSREHPNSSIDQFVGAP